MPTATTATITNSNDLELQDLDVSKILEFIK